MKKYLKIFEKYIWVAALATLTLSGCEENPTEAQDYQPEAMLAAYLYNGEPVEEVYLEWTDGFLGSYIYDEQVITGADIKIYPLDANGDLDSANVLDLVDDVTTSGHYIASDMTWLPEGLKTYKIFCKKATDGINLTATTTIPDTFTVFILPPDSTTMQQLPAPPDTLHLPNATDSLTREAPEIYLAWTPSDSFGGYLMNYLCLVDTADLVPLDPDFIIGEDELDDEDKNRFGIDLMLKEQQERTIPWLFFGWVGTYELQIMASCLDYFDYVYYGTRIMQGLSMDLPTNVEGGKGIFAGLSRHTFKLTLKRVDE